MESGRKKSGGTKAGQWHRSKSPGIRFREHPTRKHGVNLDRYFVLRFRPERGKPEKQEALGWASEGWTLEKAVARLSELKENKRLGAGPVTLKEKRDMEAARKTAEAAARKKQAREGVTVKDFYVDSFLRTQGHKDRATTDREAGHFRNWILPAIGKKPLREIVPLDLERLKKKILDAGKSPRTLQHIFSSFRLLWSAARRAGVVSGDSPTRGVKLVRFDNRRQRFFSPQEAEAILEALRGSDLTAYRTFLLSLRTGLRAKEIFTLQWKAVDTDRGAVAVIDTKSRRNRVVFMTADLREMFAGMKRGDPAALVFTNSDGRQILEPPKIIRETIDSLRLNEGVTDRRFRATFHSARHTYASWHAEGGTDLYILKELLGHSTIQLTERYSHLTPETLSAATANLERRIRATSTPAAVETVKATG